MYDSKVVRDLRVILKTLGFHEAAKNADDLYKAAPETIEAKIKRFDLVSHIYGRAEALKDYVKPNRFLDLTAKKHAA